MFVILFLVTAIRYNKLRASSYTYEDFHSIYTVLLKDFHIENYSLISNDVELRMITVLPDGLLTEKRNTLCLK